MCASGGSRERKHFICKHICMFVHVMQQQIETQVKKTQA
jgi:hypothetical protein